ncbi:hypothetical protein [Oscillatoria salina]|uniref:hypothetical protein n=1 Tax=Oscillatoria salina TaxID=331517 RepID=UPI001CCAEB22|nr:hypothetical protein [Oscillatoria salina]MBZ8183102.1 hypothetical protein [Oscillatoria salina IIICB1]
MKLIQLKLTTSEVEVPKIEADMILYALKVIVKEIPLWEFQTIMGYYMEEVQSLIDKLHTITESHQSLEIYNFDLSFDELYIIHGALRECGYTQRNKSVEKELFQSVEKLIKQIKDQT